MKKGEGEGLTVLVTSAIIDQGLGQGGFDAFLRGRRPGGEVHSEFEQVERRSRVAFGKGGQVLEEVIVDERGGRIVGAFGLQRSLKDRGDVFVRELLQREGATAG